MKESKFEPLAGDRRTLLKAMGIGLGSLALGQLAACSDAVPEKAQPKTPPGIIGKDGRRVLPWRNWSGNQHAQPTRKQLPRSEAQLQSMLAKADQPVRFVGSGHSFSGLVPTEHTLMSLARMRGVTAVDTQAQTADIKAGTVLAKLGDPLWEAGLALNNMPDVNVQSLAGAIATSTHGTGRNFGSMSSDVLAMRMVDASGQVHTCSDQQNAELFAAARNNLGVLGAVSEVRMQLRPAFNIEEKSWILPLEEAMQQATALSKQHRHFELYAFPHADYMLMITLDERGLEVPVNHPEPEESDSQTLRKVADWTERLPFLRRRLLNMGLQDIEPRQRVDRSYRIYGNLRDLRFNEMEYSVPMEQGLACLQEVLDTIKRQSINVVFPIEFRYVQADDIWLSPFYQRNSCAISCHNFHDQDYKAYFAVIEPIFRKYQGRPHWGKLHTLTAKDFAEIYPKFGEFNALRRELDPKGQFLNPHLRRVLETG